MATAEEIVRFRQLINEPDDSNGWTDERIDDVLVASANPDGSFDFRAAAQSGWEQKAAYAAELVNITENGSSRSTSQVFDHYMALAKAFGAGSSDDTGKDTLQRPRSMKIERPTRNG